MQNYVEVQAAKHVEATQAHHDEKHQLHRKHDSMLEQFHNAVKVSKSEVEQIRGENATLRRELSDGVRAQAAQLASKQLELNALQDQLTAMEKTHQQALSELLQVLMGRSLF